MTDEPRETNKTLIKEYEAKKNQKLPKSILLQWRDAHKASEVTSFFEEAPYVSDLTDLTKMQNVNVKDRECVKDMNIRVKDLGLRFKGP